MTVVKESKLQEALEGLKQVSFLQVGELLSFLMCQRLPYGIGTKAGERLEWRAMRSSHTSTKIRGRH